MTMNRRGFMATSMAMAVATATGTELEQVRQTATPALFARTVSKGKWKLARHLHYLDRAITDTITGTDDCRRLLVMMPPRHGKSELCSHYTPSWYLGTFPDRRVILTSYEADFAAKWGRKARSTTDLHGHLFGVEVSPTSAAANRWELEGYEGGMETAGIGGAITGKGAHLFITDDPVKNWEQASSEKYRETAWDWFTSTAYTRLEPDAAMIVFHTRWDEDDLAGRLIKQMDQGGEIWRVVRMPAIAEENDCLGRNPGEALWPERYNEAALEKIKLAVGPRVWSALYQQRPSPIEGGMFKRDWFEFVADAPRKFDHLVRAWDIAATEGDGDFTASVLMGTKSDRVWILDAVRGQWSSGKRDDHMSLIAMHDEQVYGTGVQIWFPQDPAAAGKHSAQVMRVNLSGYSARYETVDRKNKALRADPFASRCWAGSKSGDKVKILVGTWNRQFVDELCMFPNGSHDDQVDAVSLAYKKAVNPKKVLVA